MFHVASSPQPVSFHPSFSQICCVLTFPSAAPGSQDLDDFYSFDPGPATWSTRCDVSCSAPSARSFSALACVGKKLFVFGGTYNAVSESRAPTSTYNRHVQSLQMARMYRHFNVTINLAWKRQTSFGTMLGFCKAL